MRSLAQMRMTAFDKIHVRNVSAAHNFCRAWDCPRLTEPRRSVAGVVHLPLTSEGKKLEAVKAKRHMQRSHTEILHAHPTYSLNEKKRLAKSVLCTTSSLKYQMIWYSVDERLRRLQMKYNDCLPSMGPLHTEQIKKQQIA